MENIYNFIIDTFYKFEKTEPCFETKIIHSKERPYQYQQKALLFKNGQQVCEINPGPQPDSEKRVFIQFAKDQIDYYEKQLRDGEVKMKDEEKIKNLIKELKSIV